MGIRLMDADIANLDKQKELKKHVNAIHCTNNLSLVQRKLVNALLYNAYPNLPHYNKFQIPVRSLCNLIGYNSNDYNKLKTALIGLITIAIEWNVIDCNTGTERKWKASSILSAAELSGGLCTYEYSQIMKELLYQPEIYGKIDVKTLSKFKSGYGLALYENCIRYQGLKQTPWFPLEVFRKLMGVLGEKYPAFKDFKKRVLNIAVDEVNRVSKITILPEIETKNKKVTKIRFLISKDTLTQRQMDINDLLKDDIKETLLTSFNLSAQAVDSLLSQYSSGYISEKVDLIIQSDNFKQGKIRGLAGYLIDSLRKDYQLSQSSKIVINEQQKQIELAKIEKKEKEDKLQINYDKYIRNKVEQYLSSISDSDNQQLKNEFIHETKTKNQIMYQWYLKYNFDHVGIKACFYDFILRHRSNDVGSITSFEEFSSLVEGLN